MKKLYYLAALLTLPLLASSARADGCFWPLHVDANVNLSWRINCGNGGGGAQLGPWYNYWPLEAHFNTPAPTGYPYWPGPQVLLTQPHPPGPPMPSINPVPPPAPQPEVKPNTGPEVKPIGYFYYPYPYSQPKIYVGPAPSYWNSRP